MFERLSLAEMGGIGFTIGPMVRFNCYKTPDLFQKWNGPAFEPIISAIEIHLNRKHAVSSPTTSSAQEPLVPQVPAQQASVVFRNTVTINPKSKKTLTINPNKIGLHQNESNVDLLSEESIKKFNQELNLVQKNKNNTGVPYYGLNDPKAYKNKIEEVKPEDNKPSTEKQLNQVKIIKQEQVVEGSSANDKVKEDKKSVELPISKSVPVVKEPSKEIKVDDIKVVINKPETTTSDVSKDIKAKEAVKPNIQEIEITASPVVLTEDLLESLNYKRSDAQIVLKSKKITAIDQYAFRGWRQIEGLYLNDNEITQLEYGTFNGMPKLNSLSFEFNSINRIQSGLFGSLASLQYLKLNCNQIKSIDKSAFNGLYNLKSLDLSNNVLKNVDRATFGDLINLLSLYLNNNLIKQLDGDVFSGLVSLESLDLHGNFIRKFQESTFKNLPKLKYLDIVDNPLDSFDGDAEEFEGVEVTV